MADGGAAGDAAAMTMIRRKPVKITKIEVLQLEKPFANPDRDPFWFEIYDRKPRIEKSVLYLDNTPGFGIEFNQKALREYGTKVL